ncbi:MAG TPA: AMP-binding protein [Amycolatopsis sp.]|nr:AMP-binding protein [Amycolatopsis sp.]
MTAPADSTVQHVGMLASRAAQRWPDRTFAVLEDRELTFAELSRWVDAIAGDLAEHGVAAGDRVLVHLPNGYEVLLFQLAAWRLGAVAVPVVTIYRRRELEFIVREVEPAAIVTTAALSNRDPRAEFDEMLAAAGRTETPRYLVGGEAKGWLGVPSLPSLPAGPASLSASSAGPDDCCLVLFTSGTTADPKGVRLSSRALVTATRAWIGIGAGQDDVTLAIAPLAHIAGMIPGGLLPLTVGCRVVVMPRWDVEVAVRLIDRHQATLSCGATVFLQDLVDRYAIEPPAVHRLSHFVSGGAPTPPDLVRRADAVGMRASRAFGMTETAGVITLAPPDSDLERRATYDGCLVDAVDAKVVDEVGEDVGRGVEGALRIRGPQNLMGYTDTRLTAEQIHDGWFDPGDLAMITEDGWLRITGRTKDIINRGGEKFSARDIEEAILSHPSISRVAVTGLPDERLGEKVGAFLALASGASWEGEGALIAHLMELGLAKAKIPTVWTVVDQLPVTLSGKVQKHVLKRMWMEER